MAYHSFDGILASLIYINREVQYEDGLFQDIFKQNLAEKEVVLVDML